jgi:hypothetical protein
MLNSPTMIQVTDDRQDLLAATACDRERGADSPVRHAAAGRACKRRVAPGGRLSANACLDRLNADSGS